MRDPRRARGLSFAELMFVISLLLLLIGLGTIAFRRGTGGAGSRALAEVVAEELRRTRNLAISTALPVALSFPNSSSGCCRSFQRLTGQWRGQWGGGTATIVWCQTWGAEFKSAVFVGQWAGGSFGPATEMFGPIETFDLDAWLNGVVGNDATIVFSSAGHAKANTTGPNSIPAVGGKYRIVVASGVAITAVSPGFAASLQDPYTVTVSPLGDISVEPGLPTGFAAQGNAPAPDNLGAPRPPRRDNRPPVITSIELNPENNKGIYQQTHRHAISETLAELYPEPSKDPYRNLATVTMVVYAHDPDNDNLYFQWESAPQNGQGPGSFSYRDFGVMGYLGDGNNIGLCDWQPPARVESEQDWRFYVTVRDPYGGMATSKGDARFTPAKEVTVSSSARIAFDRYDTADFTVQDAVYVMNADGTSVQRLTNLATINENNPALSPNGGHLLFDVTEKTKPKVAQIYLSTSDGKDRQQITEANLDHRAPKWSPDGTHYFFYRQKALGSSKYELFVAHPRKGSTAWRIPNVETREIKDVHPTWSGDSQWIAAYEDTGLPYTGDDYEKLLWVCKRNPQQSPPDSSEFQRLLDGNKDLADGQRWMMNVRVAAWSPKGDEIAIVGKKLRPLPADTEFKVWILGLGKDPATGKINPLDETRQRVIGPLLNSKWAWDVSYSHGGRFLAYVADGSDGDCQYEWRVARRTSWGSQGFDPPVQYTGYDCFHPNFSYGANYVVVDAYRSWSSLSRELFRFPVGRPDSEYPMNKTERLTEVSKDVYSHSISR